MGYPQPPSGIAISMVYLTEWLATISKEANQDRLLYQHGAKEPTFALERRCFRHKCRRFGQHHRLSSGCVWYLNNHGLLVMV